MKVMDLEKGDRVIYEKREYIVLRVVDLYDRIFVDFCENSLSSNAVSSVRFSENRDIDGVFKIVELVGDK